jgi:hypothetical protein
LQLKGHLDLAEHHCLVGWAADLDEPLRRVELSVSVNGQEIDRFLADYDRPDLARNVVKGGDGRHGFRYYFSQPLTLTKSYLIEVRFVETEQHIPRGAYKLPSQRIGAPDGLTPILVTSSGRAGSTLLMHRLSRESAVVVGHHYPFELKLTTYFSKAFDVLTSPSPESDPETIYEDPSELSLNPFHHHQYANLFPDIEKLFHFYRYRAAPRIGRTFMSVIDDFYQELRIVQGKQNARFFAEKCSISDPIRNFVHDLNRNTREFVLIRDPRDTYCSYRAFWHTSPQDALQAMRVLRSAINQVREQGNEHVMFLRYEDLLQESFSREAFHNHLGIPSPAPIDAAAERAMFSSHGTAKDADSSVGRWQRELSPDEMNAFNREFGALLLDFGYSLA